MRRHLLLGAVVASLLGCQPCLERCAGQWNVSIQGDSLLPDGEYTVVVTPEFGSALEGTCTISEESSSAECEGNLHARAVDDPEAYTFLSVDVHETTSTEAQIRVTVDAVTVVDESYPVDYEDSNSCNPHCKFASVPVSL